MYRIPLKKFKNTYCKFFSLATGKITIMQNIMLFNSVLNDVTNHGAVIV